MVDGDGELYAWPRDRDRRRVQRRVPDRASETVRKNYTTIGTIPAAPSCAAADERLSEKRQDASVLRTRHHHRHAVGRSDQRRFEGAAVRATPLIMIACGGASGRRAHRGVIAASNASRYPYATPRNIVNELTGTIDHGRDVHIAEAVVPTAN
jgi:hypothetical protein